MALAHMAIGDAVHAGDAAHVDSSSVVAQDVHDWQRDPSGQVEGPQLKALKLKVLDAEKPVCQHDKLEFLK